MILSDCLFVCLFVYMCIYVYVGIPWKHMKCVLSNTRQIQIRKIKKNITDIVNTVNHRNITCVQLCGAPDSSKFFDQSFQDGNHSICLHDHLIFDSNQKETLPLTMDNLDLCCLGEKWIFHHIVRSFEVVLCRKRKR